MYGKILKDLPLVKVGYPGKEMSIGELVYKYSHLGSI